MKFVTHPLSSPDLLKQFKHVRPDAALVARLRESIDLLRPKADALTATFYANLFAQYPMLRGMFPSDMTAQRKKLFDSLDFVITHLDLPEQVHPALADLGRRHTDFGAKAEHYPIVRDTLVKAMRSVANDDWSDAVEADWLIAIELIGAAMQQS